ncbi:hypothetical protein [Granulicella sp. dw_53]|uniref:hypothetical protein n=1 Tax=Granulicella sp. dw_53 TaxID=2719792 RepID=UPI001BD318E9|nr:hypothetical protein [Granulicella sp. dw_53]
MRKAPAVGPGAFSFLISTSILVRVSKLKCHLYVADLAWVRWFKGLTCDFAEVFGRKKGGEAYIYPDVYLQMFPEIEGKLYVKTNSHGTSSDHAWFFGDPLRAGFLQLA